MSTADAAIDKPASDGTDDGIKVQASSSETLKIDESGHNDDWLIVAHTVSSATSVTVTDADTNVGHTRLGS